MHGCAMVQARPPRCLLGYATERLLVLVVLRDDGGGGPGLDSRQLAAMASEVSERAGLSSLTRAGADNKRMTRRLVCVSTGGVGSG